VALPTRSERRRKEWETSGLLALILMVPWRCLSVRGAPQLT
jgi:hypothetical protein